MKRLNVFSFLLLGLLMMPGAARAGDSGATSGPATTYQVTVTQIELCATGSSIDSSGASPPVCVDPTVIGTGTAVFDIASVGAGQAVGDYSSFDSLPPGRIYRYVRARLSRRFVIGGTLPSGCRTDSADTSSSTTSAGIGIHDSAPGTPQVLYIPDPGSLSGQPLQSDYWSNGLYIIDDSSFSIMYPLGGTITGGGAAPTITVAFNTQMALSGDYNGEVCLMYPARPTVDLRVD